MSGDTTIPADLLRQVLTEPASTPRRWIALADATIDGRLDLDSATLTCGLRATDCVFTDVIDLSNATTPEITLKRCRLPRLRAAEVTVRGSLDLRSSRVAHAITLVGGRIDGELNLTGVEIEGDGSTDGVMADNLVLGLSLVAKRLRARAPVALRGAEVGTQCQFGGAVLEGTPIALDMERARVGNNVFFDDGFIARGQVDLGGADLAGELDIAGAQLLCAEWSLSLRVARLGADLLVDDVTFTGGVHLGAAKVEGEVRIENSRFGSSLVGPRLWVRDDVSIAATQISGEIDLRGLHVGGGLATDDVKAIGDLDSEVRFDGARVGQDLRLNALSCNRRVSLVRAQIAGTLSLKGSRLTGLGTALDATNMHVGALALFEDGFTARGAVVMPAAEFASQVSFRDATLEGFGAAAALDLERARIADGLFLTFEHVDGTVDLTDATISAVIDAERSWPDGLRLKGLAYERIEAMPQVSVEKRLTWLRREVDGYVPGNYATLATAYRAAGVEEDARKVTIAGRRRGRAELAFPSRLWDVILDRGIAYGYATWRAVVGLLVLATLGAIVFSAQYPEHFTATKTGRGASQPPFHAITYTLDVLVPVVSLRQRDAWTPDGYALWWSVGLTFAGWVLTTAVVAALTGLLRRE